MHSHISIASNFGRHRKLAGIPFSLGSLSEASAKICDLAKADNNGADIHLLNAYSIALAESKSDYRECLETAVINFPDGKPLSLITKFSSRPLGHVRGPSLFEQVIDEGRVSGVRHYLLGSTEETLKALQISLEERYPGVQIVGSMSPPFRPLSDDELNAQDQIIRDSQPDIVWVGLGTPKQDYEAQRLATDSGFVAIAVGAAFDFSAGTKREAPAWMRKLSIEWVFRFMAEPKRLWRRYLVGNAVFLFAVLSRRSKINA